MIIGLVELKEPLNRITENALAYRKGKIQPPHLAMNLSPKDGQTYVAEEIASIYYDNKVKECCDLDPVLEYRLDGSFKQIKWVFEDLRNRAVYENSYCGIVAIDITALSEHINENQTDYFIDNIVKVAETATMIFYYDDSHSKKAVVIKDLIIKSVGNCIDIHLSPYSVGDYADIVVETLKGRGFNVDYGHEMKIHLCSILDSEHVSTVKQAISIAEKLAFIADYSDFTPRLDSKMLVNYFKKRKSA